MSNVWVLFRLQTQVYAISSEYVREMISIPKITHVPKLPVHVRGVFTLRNQVLPTLDLRKLLGLPALGEENHELTENLKQREQDHLNWIKELEASVHEAREFKLTTDPHKCKFGQWYDHFKTESLILKNLLKKFDQPHREVHALGVQVKDLMQAHKKDEALQAIESVRGTTLHRLLALFSDVYSELSNTAREIGVVLNMNGRSMVVAVDSVVGVERLEDQTIEEMDDFMGLGRNEYIHRMAKRKQDQGLVMIIEPNALSEKIPEISS